MIVKVTLGNSRMTVDFARQCAEGRKERSALVHMLLDEFHDAIFAWQCVLERGGMPLHELHDAFGINYKEGATILKIKMQVSSIWAKGCMFDDCVCVI